MLRQQEIKDICLRNGSNKYQAECVVKKLFLKSKKLKQPNNKFYAKYYDVTEKEVLETYNILLKEIQIHKSHSENIFSKACEREFHGLHPMTVKHLFNFLNLEKQYDDKYHNWILTENQIKELKDFIENKMPKNLSVKVFLTKQTCLKKYGVENYFQSEKGRKEIKEISSKNVNERMRKTVQTKKNKYGNGLGDIKKIKQTWSNKTKEEWKEIKEKARQTSLEKYGKEHWLKNEDLKKQFIENLRNDEGLLPCQTNEVKQKIEETRQRNRQSKVDKILKENPEYVLKTPIEYKYGQGWDIYLKGIDKKQIDGVSLVAKKDIPKIIDYSNTHKYACRSRKEQELFDFVSSEIEVEANAKNKLLPRYYEIDVYIPSKKVGIEFDGLYWHCEREGVSKNNLLEKSKVAWENNIRLIHIFEDEWDNHKDICKSIINSSIGIYSKRIYARKCIFKEVNKEEGSSFVMENHIQGAINRGEYFGLYYENELVQIIQIGKGRFKKDEIELLRMTSKLNYENINHIMKYIVI